MVKFIQDTLNSPDIDLHDFIIKIFWSFRRDICVNQNNSNNELISLITI